MTKASEPSDNLVTMAVHSAFLPMVMDAAVQELNSLLGICLTAKDGKLATPNTKLQSNLL